MIVCLPLHSLLNMVLFVELVLVADAELEAVDAVVDTWEEPAEELIIVEVAASAVVPVVADAAVEAASPVPVDEAVASASVDAVTLPSSCRGSGWATWATAT